MPEPRLRITDLPNNIIRRIGATAHVANRQAMRLSSLRHALRNLPVTREEDVTALLRHIQQSRRKCLQVTCAAVLGPHASDHELYQYGGRRFQTQYLYSNSIRFFPKANGRFIAKYRIDGQIQDEHLNITLAQAVDLLDHHTCTPRVVQLYKLRYNPNRPNYPHTTTVGRAIYRRVLH